MKREICERGAKSERSLRVIRRAVFKAAPSVAEFDDLNLAGSHAALAQLPLCVIQRLNFMW